MAVSRDGATGQAGLLRWWRWAVVLAYMGVIFAASSRSDVSIPGNLSDKVAHAGAYALLSTLIVWAVTSGQWTRVSVTTVLGATVASVLYGWSDEVHQLFVPNRQYEVLDMVADAAGAFLAASALWAWGILLRGSARRHGL